jgi:hypothetical protein
MCGDAVEAPEIIAHLSARSTEVFGENSP